jgi:hypothetical protein
MNNKIKYISGKINATSTFGFANKFGLMYGVGY